MARESTGQVVVRERAGGRVYALRFRANGQRQYVTLGAASEGWDQRRAEEALKDELAKVRAGVWRTPRPETAPKLPDDPTFHEFASEWWASKRSEVSPNTQIDYEWQLTSHLLPFFAKHRLSQITVAEVDRYRRHKVAEGTLSPASINKTLTRLGQILDLADEYEMIQRNPLRVNPRNRRRCGWIAVTRSRRCSTVPGSWTLVRGLIVGTFRAGRCWRRWCSAACASGSCSRSGGETWISRPDGSTWASPRPMRG
jgi:hypothetical protein